MYPVSSKFHDAVYQTVQAGSERIRMRFGDTLFTNEDIHMNSGITLIEAANLEEELTIGACVSSNLSGTVINFHRLLDGFAFGACEVSLGIRTETAVFSNPPSSNPNTYAIFRYGDTNQVCFSGHSEEPYLRVDGAAPTVQPPFPVYSIYIEGHTIT